jgi:hypothetical protein
MLSSIFLLPIIIVIIYILFIRKKEAWCNTYSGWPGPLESPCMSNIPALYGNPKYMSDCHYTYNPKSTTGYLPMKNLPH